MLTVVGAVMALGTVQVPVLLVVSVFALVTAIVSLGEGPLPGARVPPPAVVLFGLSVYCMVQALPLPIGVLEVIASENAETWSRSLRPLGAAGPAFASVSLDPGASLVEALKWLTYANIFVAASIAGARHGTSWGALLLFGTGLLVAGVTVIHGAVGAERAYGIYQPTFGIARWHLGPLLNPNNLSGYLNLCTMAGLGLIVLKRPVAPVWALGLGIAATLAASLIAASKGGALSLPLGVAALALVSSWRRKSGARDLARPAATTGALVAVVLGGVVLAALGATGDTVRELGGKGVEKLSMPLWAAPMLRDHFWFGIGRGAFESVFPAYRMGLDHVIYTHAENFVVQWFVEWGAPVAFLALCSLAWLLRPGVLKLRSRGAAVGVVVGCLTLLVQNLADLALEVPGVVITVAAGLGVCWGAAASPRDDDSGKRWRSRSIAGVVTAFTAVTVAAVWLWGMVPVTKARLELEALVTQSDLRDPRTREVVQEKVRAGIQRYPAEAYFPLAGATNAWIGREESPMPWMQSVLERAPQSGRAHLLLAHILADWGIHHQAMLELRLAAEFDRYAHNRAAALALRITRDYEKLLSAVPAGDKGVGMLISIANQSGSSENGLRLACLQEAVRRKPGDPAARMKLASLWLTLWEGGDPLCSESKQCELSAEEHIGKLERVTDRGVGWVELRGRQLLVLGEAPASERFLAEQCPVFRQAVECGRLRMRAAVAVGDPQRISEAGKSLQAAGCAGAKQCAKISSWLGDVAAGQGLWQLATKYYERAAEEEPSSGRWLQVARAARQAGSRSRAMVALSRASSSPGGGAEAKAKIDAERKRLMVEWAAQEH